MQTLAPLGMIGFQELWPILLILVLLFGAKKLPELARSMGLSIKMFKKGLSEADEKAELPDGGGGTLGAASSGAGPSQAESAGGEREDETTAR